MPKASAWVPDERDVRQLGVSGVNGLKAVPRVGLTARANARSGRQGPADIGSHQVAALTGPYPVLILKVRLQGEGTEIRVRSQPGPDLQ